jgi:hypothetical protein
MCPEMKAVLQMCELWRPAAWNLFINARQFKNISAIQVLEVKLHMRCEHLHREAGTATTMSNGISCVAKSLKQARG